MGGTAPAHQPRLSFTGSEDGEAETETWSGEALVANDDSTLRPARAQLTEPPYADPPVRWCGRGERVTAPPIPISRSPDGRVMGEIQEFREHEYGRDAQYPPRVGSRQVYVSSGCRSPRRHWR